MSTFTEKLAVYNLAVQPINRKNPRRVIELPGKSKIFVCDSPLDVTGKSCIYKLELGNTQHFGIVSTSTPFSRAINLAYCSSTIKAYGGKAYMKFLRAFDNDKDARIYAEDLRKDLEVTDNNFKRL